MRSTDRERVFQLSLTEIAFILVFLLLLLLGWRLLDAQVENENGRLEKSKLEQQNHVLRKQLEKYKDAESYDELLARYTTLKDNIKQYLKEQAIPEPNRILDDLVSIAKLDEEIKKLQQELSKEKFESKACKAAIGGDGTIDISKFNNDFEQVEKLEQLLAALKRKGVKATSVEELVEQFFNNVKEVENLRKKCGGGAIGACWRDDNGKTEKLLDISLEPDYIKVTVANMTDSRREEMQKLPSIDLASRSNIPYGELERSFGPILEWSKDRTPECRHYVSIRSNIPLTKESTPRRLQVQQYFYPDESKK